VLGLQSSLLLGADVEAGVTGGAGSSALPVGDMSCSFSTLRGGSANTQHVNQGWKDVVQVSPLPCLTPRHVNTSSDISQSYMGTKLAVDARQALLGLTFSRRQ
jgi:hypothetical protein